MSTNKKIIYIPISFIFFFLIFTVLDFGMEVKQLNQLIQTTTFVLAVVIGIFIKQLRQVILIISLTFLLFMILTYLLNLLDISNWIGSLGFGMLFITIFSYLPQLIKKGYIEKF